MAMATEEDRLSSLHDFLLLEIIERLPLREGFATTILSNRYKNVFFLINKIKIDFTEELWVSPNYRKAQSFIGFIGFLSRLNLERIEVFCTGDLPWLGKIGDLVRSSMEFCLRDKIPHISFNICDRILIPREVFSLQNLNSLDIDSYIYLKKNVVFSLPMVQNLSFTNIVFESETSIGRLTDSCPSLRFLKLYTDFGAMMDSMSWEDRLQKRSYAVKIAHANLESLELAISDYQGSKRMCRFTLDAPKLQLVTLVVNEMVMGRRIWFSGEIPCIKLDGSLLNQLRERYGDAVIAFTKSFEVVKMLKAKKLILPPSAFENIRSVTDMRDLVGLTCLEVAVTPHRLQMVFDLISSTSELSYLVIHLEHETDNQCLQRAKTWRVRATLEKLRKCRITGYTGERKMLELLECLVMNACALELLDILVCGPVVPQIKDFQHRLSSLPRGSKRCEFRVNH